MDKKILRSFDVTFLISMFVGAVALTVCFTSTMRTTQMRALVVMFAAGIVAIFTVLSYLIYIVLKGD